MNKAMTIKADWDMSININRLKKEVENNPKKFYQNNATQKITIQEPVQDLRKIDAENLKLEIDFAKFKTIQKFDSLIKRVGSDIDKKSTFSKKL